MCMYIHILVSLSSMSLHLYVNLQALNPASQASEADLQIQLIRMRALMDKRETGNSYICIYIHIQINRSSIYINEPTQLLASVCHAHLVCHFAGWRDHETVMSLPSLCSRQGHTKKQVFMRCPATHHAPPERRQKQNKKKKLMADDDPCSSTGLPSKTDYLIHAFQQPLKKARSKLEFQRGSE